MVIRWLVAFTHLAAFGIGAAAITFRARALRRLRDVGGLKQVFEADTWWGVAALLWLSTGVWRAFGGLEKGSAYYLGHPLFLAKLGLIALVLGLEVWPMTTLIRWRLARRRGAEPELGRAVLFARVSCVQLVALFAIVFVAVAIARGWAVAPPASLGTVTGAGN